MSRSLLNANYQQVDTTLDLAAPLLVTCNTPQTYRCSHL